MNVRTWRQVASIVREGGVGSLAYRALGFGYRRGLRGFFPSDPVRYAGVPIDLDRCAADRMVPADWLPDLHDKPRYEEALVTGLRMQVRAGDRVVVVGCGLGVTAVVAAECAGSQGRVDCYEGSFQQYCRARKTFKRSKMPTLHLHHAVVGESIAVYGDPAGRGASVSPRDLPVCEVMELDCEGAELPILRAMTVRPRAIVVETHGAYGAPTEVVAGELETLGYDVDDLGLAEPCLHVLCEQNDIRVLSAVRGDA